MLTLIDLVQDFGGAERFALALATHLPRDRIEPWMCATREITPEAQQILDEHGIPYIALERRTKRDVHRLAGLERLLRRERFDALHAHKFGSNLWGTLLGRLARVPVIVAHEHTWSYQGDPVRTWLDGRVIGRLATRFVAVSSNDARRMIELERVPSQKVVVIPAAIHLRRRAAESDVRGELGLPADVPVVSTACLLRPQKAISVLLRAFALVHREIPEAHLVIAGGGPCRIELERLAQELGLGSRAHFLGGRDDVDSILAVSDIGALSSDWEGTPLFVAECLASGTPVVATAVGGLPDLVEDGVTGALVPPRDPFALADALTQLLKNPARRRLMGQAAARRARELTPEALAGRFADLYEELVREARRAHHGQRATR